MRLHITCPNCETPAKGYKTRKLSSVVTEVAYNCTVRLLIDIAPDVFTSARFAMKGGTAKAPERAKKDAERAAKLRAKEEAQEARREELKAAREERKKARTVAKRAATVAERKAAPPSPEPCAESFDCAPWETSLQTHGRGAPMA